MTRAPGAADTSLVALPASKMTCQGPDQTETRTKAQRHKGLPRQCPRLWLQEGVWKLSACFYPASILVMLGTPPSLQLQQHQVQNPDPLSLLFQILIFQGADRWHALPGALRQPGIHRGRSLGC